MVPVPLVETLAFVKVIGPFNCGATICKLPFAPADTKEFGLTVTPPAPRPAIVIPLGPVKPVLTEFVTTEPGTDVIDILPEEFVRTVPFNKTLPPTLVNEMSPLFVLMLVNAVWVIPDATEVTPSVPLLADTLPKLTEAPAPTPVILTLPVPPAEIVPLRIIGELPGVVSVMPPPRLDVKPPAN